MPAAVEKMVLLASLPLLAGVTIPADSSRPSPSAPGSSIGSAAAARRWQEAQLAATPVLVGRHRSELEVGRAR
ncbi:MAG: hypothetical protein HS111_06000 [Kofleriaceae bacterium]|nr:hypothetical protein [Kofleriaceae bacterium]